VGVVFEVQTGDEFLTVVRVHLGFEGEGFVDFFVYPFAFFY